MVLQPLSLVLILSNPLPQRDPCPYVLEVLDGGPGAAAAARELFEIGAPAVPAIAETLNNGPTNEVAVLLLGLMMSVRDVRADAAIRPFVFARAPYIAALATRAHSLANGPRSVSMLEHLLRQNRSFEQSLAALEGLADHKLPSSFPAVAAFAGNTEHDPVLRATAARMLPSLDRKKTKRWFKKLAPAAATSPFLKTEFDAVFAAAQKKRR